MAYKNDDPIAVLSKCVIEAAKNQIAKAKFDKTTIGVIKAKDNDIYTVFAFGKDYRVQSSQTFSVHQNVAVTAPQGDFKRLLLRVI